MDALPAGERSVRRTNDGRGQMTSVRRILLVLLLLTAGTSLLLDGAFFVLVPFDPVTGRERGCFTMAELALGLRSPTSWARMLELALGAAAIVTAWRVRREKRRRAAV